MTINLKMPDIKELKPKITVFGVGGAGGNAVNNMIRSGLHGCEFVVANTDSQALTSSRAERMIQMGVAVTEGLGAGSQPEVGRAAAEEAIDEIIDHLSGSHMVFVTAGMGGGTGTGAAPIIARAAREQGILTVGVVTKPFQFEGARRMRVAEAGIKELQACVDTLIVIPNQNLFRIANEKTTFADAFAMADQVLYSGVACITDLMVKEGLINLDFADVRSVMREMGKAMMGTGEASGERRAIQAAEAAIANPLLDETSMKGAKGLLISITGGKDLTLFEVDEAATRIREEVDPDANIILGATFEEALEGVIRVSVVATGIDSEAREDSTPAESRMAELSQRLPHRDPAGGRSRAGRPDGRPRRCARPRAAPQAGPAAAPAAAGRLPARRRRPPPAPPRSRRRSPSRATSTSPSRPTRRRPCDDSTSRWTASRRRAGRADAGRGAVHPAARRGAAVADAAGRGFPAGRPAPDRGPAAAAAPARGGPRADEPAPPPRQRRPRPPRGGPARRAPAARSRSRSGPARRAQPAAARQPQQRSRLRRRRRSDYAKRPPRRGRPTPEPIYRPRQAELDQHGRPLPRDAPADRRRTGDSGLPPPPGELKRLADCTRKDPARNRLDAGP